MSSNTFGSFNRVLIFFLLILLILTVIGSLLIGRLNHKNVPSEDIFSIVRDSVKVTTYDASRAMNGYTLFDIRINNVSTEKNLNYITVFIDMEGNILNFIEGCGCDVEFINSTTVMYIESDNVIFYNIDTNKTETISIGKVPHHDIEYNPLTNEFLVLTYEDYGEFDGIPIRYDSIYRIDRTGDVLWYWNGSVHFSFDTKFSKGEPLRGVYDWLHGNTIFWDIEQDCIYYNARHVDTFFKIDLNTGNIVWGIGRMGNMTCITANGSVYDTLFYHAHAVERISEKRFILFDNDYYNLTAQDFKTRIGTSRMLEIEVDETTHTASEIWSWKGEGAEYYSIPWGDADRLPNGNTLGVFGWSDPDTNPMHVTEVTHDGDIVWEVIPINNDNYFYTSYRAERFFNKPLIIPVIDPVAIKNDGNVFIEFKTWNTFKQRYHSNATAKILEGTTVLAEKNFQFLPYWQETSVSFNISDLSPRSHTLNIEVTNSDGIITTESITITNQEKGIISETQVKTEGFESLITSIGFMPFVLVVIYSRNSSKS